MRTPSLRLIQLQSDASAIFSGITKHDRNATRGEMQKKTTNKRNTKGTQKEHKRTTKRTIKTQKERKKNTKRTTNEHKIDTSFTCAHVAVFPTLFFSPACKVSSATSAFCFSFSRVFHHSLRPLPTYTICTHVAAIFFQSLIISYVFFSLSFRSLDYSLSLFLLRLVTHPYFLHIMPIPSIPCRPV